MTWPTYLLPSLGELLIAHFVSQRHAYYGSTKSPTQLIYEHCNGNGYKLSNCPAKCKGGFTEDGKTCQRCDGKSFVSRRAKDVHEQTMVCDRCNGSGRYWREKWAIHVLDEAGVPHLVGSAPNERYRDPTVRPEDLPCCTKCGRNRGFIENYNANPMMQTTETNQVSDDMLLRANGNAKVAVAMTQLQTNDSRAALCIELLFGDVGEQASTVPVLGRDFALWPLTVAGSQLIDMGLAERGKAKQQSCALPKTHRIILRQLSAEVDLTRSLSNMAQVSAAALRMDAIAKLHVADRQTGGHVLAQVTNGRMAS